MVPTGTGPASRTAGTSPPLGGLYLPRIVTPVPAVRGVADARGSSNLRPGLAAGGSRPTASEIEDGPRVDVSLSERNTVPV